MATTAQSDSVLELYSAYFNRAADAAGFTFWQKSFDTYLASSAGADDAAKSADALQKIAVDMSTSTEYKALYPDTLSTEDFVKAVYTNLLDRDSDAEGLAFWVGHIDKKTLTKEQAINAMIEGAKANATDQGKLDAALVTNKNAISKYFAETLKSDNVDLAKKAFTGVTADAATLDPAKAALDKEIATEGVTALTAGSDAFKGTEKDDTFSSADGTLQSEDIILDTSSADKDTLNVDMLIYNSGVQPNITSIETINVNSVTNQVGLDGTNITGTKVVKLDSTALSGTATVIGVATDKIASVETGANIVELSVTADSKGTGSAPVEITATKATKLTLTGSAKDDKFTVKTIEKDAEITFDGTTNTGGDDTLMVEDGVVAKSVTFKGGAGADTLMLKGTANAASFEIVLGDGDNTATITTAEKALTSLKLSAGSGTKDKITINLKGTEADKPADLDVSAAAGSIEELIINSSVAPSVLKLVTADLVVGANADSKLVLLGDQDITFMGDAGAFAGVNLVDASPAISTLKINTGTGGDLSGLAFNVIDVAKDAGAVAITPHKDSVIKLSAANTNNVNFTSATTDDALNIELGANQADITINTATNTNIKVTADATVAAYNNSITDSITTVTGDKALTITSLNDTGKTFDASALTGKLTVTLNDSNTAEVKAGTGADKITGGTGADKIDGGKGNDTIDGKTGNDELTGGEGNDTFVFDTTSTILPTITDLDKVTDFTTGDKIKFSTALSTVTANTATASGGTAQIKLSGIATFNSADNDLAKKIVAVESALADTAGASAIFLDSSKAYLFIEGGAAAVDATDTLIELTGVSALSTGLTFSNGEIIAIA